jgi:murein DD-endopeptidase MepM/ murein hydrolase activator NlpD
MRGVRYVVIGLCAVLAATLGTPASAASPATVDSPAMPLKVRSGPARWYGVVGTLPHGATVAPLCQVDGQLAGGTQRRTAVWVRLPSGGYVSDAYLRRGALPARCGSGTSTAARAAAAPPPVPWTHPLPGFAVQGGFRTPLRPTHLGVDLMSFRGTPVRAAAPGTVVEVVCDIQPGGSCDVPGSPTARGCGWYVKIAHPDRIATLYCHLLARPALQPGQAVAAGQVIGLIGSSGRSSYPHLHFEVHRNAPPTSPLTAVDPLPFMASVGVPMPRA